MPPKALCLAFDTSAAHVAAALLFGDQVLVAQSEDMAKGQAERLMPLLEEILAEGGADWADLTCLGVGVGPGSFTGVRISVSAARGLALGLDIKAVGVSALDAMAFGQTGSVITSIDAKLDRIYLQLQGTAPQMVALNTLPKLETGTQSACLGFQAEVLAKHYGGTAWAIKTPIAVATGHLAIAQQQHTNTRPAPIYLRPADAAPARNHGPVLLP